MHLSETRALKATTLSEVLRMKAMVYNFYMTELNKGDGFKANLFHISHLRRLLSSLENSSLTKPAEVNES